MQVLVGTKDVDGCEDIYNSTDGSGIYEANLDISSLPSPLTDEQFMPQPPTFSVYLSPYETIPEPNVTNVSLPHTDFNQEPPPQYTTLRYPWIS